MSSNAPHANLDNPILNSAYEPPHHHFALGTNGPTGEIGPGRRASESLGTINGLRRDVELWRTRGYDGVTPISRKLLLHWSDPARENRVLFCQREAAETAIFLCEVAGRRGYADRRKHLDAVNAEHNSGLPRIALKMATGTGKTVVMAMLIAWQALNRVQAPRDRRFANRFLLLAPGITVRDRLRVLEPWSEGNYYDARELVPVDLRPRLDESRIVIANYHQFLPRTRREFEGVSKTTRELLAPGHDSLSEESAEQIVSRVLRDLGARPGRIVVFNDEAHHCYQDRAQEAAGLPKEDRERNADARVWFRGLQTIANTRGYGVSHVFDLSATPFYLGGSGYDEGHIFPWTVSDFSLMDAVESGIVKIPRLPVDDDSEGEGATYRDLWARIGGSLPKRNSTALGDWLPPAELEGAMRGLYRSYEREFDRWERLLKDRGEPPPVMIVVCPNTVVSRLVSEWIAGRAVERGGRVVLRPGKLDLFSNVELRDGSDRWLARPRTLLIDSAALESGGGRLSKDFLAAAGPEIERFRAARRRSHPGADAEQLTERDLLREAMNTVGKRDSLGETIRCVVSVGMLTEGWDANTVTHILGVRAFGSQLLCEQVIGRGLRRRDWTRDEAGRFAPEYANVYGIPLAFIPGERPGADPPPPPPTIEVRSLPEREHLRIRFPRVRGYRIEMPENELLFDPRGAPRFEIGPEKVPPPTESSGIVGESELDAFELNDAVKRDAHLAFALAGRLLSSYFTDENANPRPWLFPQLIGITREWLASCVDVREGYERWHLLRSQLGLQQAAEAVFRALSWQGNKRPELIQPVFDRSAPVGHTGGVRFVTGKRVFETTHSELSHLTLDGRDGNTWENLLAHECEALANRGVIAAYAKNDRLGFDIPYLHEGRTRRYIPGYLVRLHPRPDDPEQSPRTLILDISGGQQRHHSPGAIGVKRETARDVWCTAVNNHGGFGRWGYAEIDTMTDLPQRIRQAIDALSLDDRGAHDTGQSAETGLPYPYCASASTKGTRGA